MSGKAVGWAFDDRELEPTARYVLVALADNADHLGECWPSKKHLADKTGLGESTIKKHLGTLEEMGYLVRVPQQRTNGAQSSNLYQLMMQPTMQGGHEVAGGEGQSKPPGGSPGGPLSEPSEEPSEGSGGSAAVTDETAIIDRLGALWLTETQQPKGTRLTAERRRKLRIRLRAGYDEEYIGQAIRNCGRSAFHMGENDDGKRYNDLTLICRSDEKLEWFHNMNGGGEAQQQRLPGGIPLA